MTLAAQNPQNRAVLKLLGAAIVWSTSGLFIKLLTDLSGLAIMSARSAIVAGLFLVWLRPKSFRFTRWEWVGAVSYAALQLLYIYGNKNAPAANIIFLAYTAPLYVIPMAYVWLGERANRSDLLAMLLIFGGLLLFFGDDFSFEGVRGNLYGALAGVALAVMTLAMRKQKADSPANSILLGSIIGTLIGIPTLMQATFTTTNVLILVYMGLFQIGLGFIWYTEAVRHVTALQSTLLTMIEPIINPIWVFLVLGEVPGRLAFIGAAFVLIGVIYRALATVRE